MTADSTFVLFGIWLDSVLFTISPNDVLPLTKSKLHTQSGVAKMDGRKICSQNGWRVCEIKETKIQPDELRKRKN